MVGGARDSDDRIRARVAGLARGAGCGRPAADCAPCCRFRSAGEGLCRELGATRRQHHWNCRAADGIGSQAIGRSISLDIEGLKIFKAEVAAFLITEFGYSVS